MGYRRPSNECSKQDPGVTLPQDAGHVRRSSVCSVSSNTEVSSTLPQKQELELQHDRSQEPSAGLDYDPSLAAPTPMPTTPPDSPLSDPPDMPPPYTEYEIREDILYLIRENIDPGGARAADAFENADEKPPITPDSLAELDIPRIINNPKLRHDVNFDRELHFRPNLDGSKGRQKLQQANQYWRALETEFFMLKYALIQKTQNPTREEYWTRVSKASAVRLPIIFAAIRDILKTLVPDYDQPTVKERLDVDHIMQQILNGVCDLLDLANWLAKILKNHCAPMRDALVDSMRTKIAQGAEQNDHEKLVTGLRQLMNILEAMKLDVANHQIRHMRPLLIDDTVHFQQRYNAYRIDIRKLSVQDAKEWISGHQQPFGCEPTPLLALTRGLIVDITYNDTSTFCPPTFYLDTDRLRVLRVELHSRVYHSICRDVLREIANHGLPEPELLRACDTLTVSVAAIVGPQGRFADKMENIAAEIVRVLLDAEGRYPPIDADLTSLVEQRLSACLRQACPEFREHAMSLAERLIPKVQASVHEHSKIAAINLQDMLVPQAAPPKQIAGGFGAHCEPVPASPPPFAGDPDADLIRRLTHILAIHWQVWSDLVYLAEDIDKDDDSVSDNGSESTIVQSRASSPVASSTVPIATAVYAPGGKWLPVSVTITDVPAAQPARSQPSDPADGNTTDSNEQADDHFNPKNRQPA